MRGLVRVRLESVQGLGEVNVGLVLVESHELLDVDPPLVVEQVEPSSRGFSLVV